MKKSLGVFLVIALAVLCACLQKTEQPDYPIMVETIEGIRTVTNPEYPRDGRFDLLLTEDFTVGSGIGDEPGVLNQPRDLKVDAGGFLFVMDPGDINIKVYDPEGTFSHTIGREGQGPLQLVAHRHGPGSSMLVLRNSS